MDIDKLTLGEVKQLTALLGATKAEKNICDGGIRIVILQRGWVVVGKYSQHGEDCKISNGYVIRRWGTTEGLGELASKGPLSETKLEPCSTIEFHELTVVFTIKCAEDKWSAKFPR